MVFRAAVAALLMAGAAAGQEHVYFNTQNGGISSYRYLRKSGSKSVSIVGGSFGGGAAGDRFLGAVRDESHGIPRPNGPAEKLKCFSLFIVPHNDANADGRALAKIRAQYEKAPEPKQLILLDRSAHA